jgi:formamidopyrimidine-DNA glycosylase
MKLGPEPYGMTGQELYDAIHHRKAMIKPTILNQAIISGIGNIYADEILFAANIDPERKDNTITLKECDDIISNAIRIFNASIKAGGSTVKDYQHLSGEGQYQHQLKVHIKAGSPCPDGGTVQKIKVAGRGTY